MWDSKISSLPTPRCEASAFYQPRKPRASKTQGFSLNFPRQKSKSPAVWGWTKPKGATLLGTIVPYPYTQGGFFRVDDDFPKTFFGGSHVFSFPGPGKIKTNSNWTQQVFDWFASTVAKWAGVVCTWVDTVDRVGFFIKSHAESEEFQMTQQRSWWITNPKKCTIFPLKFGTLKFFPYICCHCLIFFWNGSHVMIPAQPNPKKKTSSKGTWLAFVASKDRPNGTSGASATQAPASHVLKKSPKDLEIWNE